MSTTVRVSADKDVRSEARALRALGWTWSDDSAGHPVLHHPTYGSVTLPSTPKPGGRWRQRVRRDIARRMGVSLAELEARIAGQATVGKRAASHKRPYRSRRPARPRALVAVREPDMDAPVEPQFETCAPVPAFAPTDPISQARRDHWHRMAGERDAANIAHRWPWRQAA